METVQPTFSALDCLPTQVKTQTVTNVAQFIVPSTLGSFNEKWLLIDTYNLVFNQQFEACYILLTDVTFNTSVAQMYFHAGTLQKITAQLLSKDVDKTDFIFFF